MLCIFGACPIDAATFACCNLCLTFRGLVLLFACALRQMSLVREFETRYRQNLVCLKFRRGMLGTSSHNLGAK